MVLSRGAKEKLQVLRQQMKGKGHMVTEREFIREGISFALFTAVTPASRIVLDT